jgi:hypothetical protein
LDANMMQAAEAIAIQQPPIWSPNTTILRLIGHEFCFQACFRASIQDRWPYFHAR